MKPGDIAREIVYPLSSFATLVPMLVSWLLFLTANFFGLFGMLLFVATVVPFFGYLMSLLDARANRKDAPAFDAELMSFVGNGWALFPLVLVALFWWLHYFVEQRFSSGAAALVAFLSSIVFPASLGVLSVTKAPLQSLNPLALVRFIKSTGIDYVLLIVTIEAVSVALYMGLQYGVPIVLLGLGLIYQSFLLYGMTGAIAGRHKLKDDVHIPVPVAVDDIEIRKEMIGERQGILSHAYGFVSRGNRAGGLQHIRVYIDVAEDKDEAYRWFFNEMLKWENSDAALFFAQDYLHRLLSQRRDAAALKLLSQCFHANPGWRPAEEDRDEAVDVAEKYGRHDLLPLLR